MGIRIEFARPDGKTAPGYYAATEHEPAKAPGIVVVQEWWGVTSEMTSIADRYASLGYRVLVPDLYRGRSAAVGDEANHLMEGLDFSDAASQDLAGAVNYLKSGAEERKVGVTGFCMGGALTLVAAMHLPQVDAAVVFYGVPPEQAGDPATIEIPLQCHFAKHDDFFAPSVVERLEERLKFGRVPYELFWYDAKHGFCNPNPPGHAGLGNFNGEAAHQATERAQKFFERTLFE